MIQAKKEKIFLHSGCCAAHWELTYSNGKYQLECEVCGRVVSGTLTVTGPLRTQEESECDICKKKRNELTQ